MVNHTPNGLRKKAVFFFLTMCLKVYGTFGAHMKNKKGLEAAFALLLLKFVPTQYLPAASFLQNMIRHLSVVLGKGLAEGNVTRDSPSTLICSDSSIALKLGSTSVVCRNALLQEPNFEEPLPAARLSHARGHRALHFGTKLHSKRCCSSAARCL